MNKNKSQIALLSMPKSSDFRTLAFCIPIYLDALLVIMYHIENCQPIWWFHGLSKRKSVCVGSFTFIYLTFNFVAAVSILPVHCAFISLNLYANIHYKTDNLQRIYAVEPRKNFDSTVQYMATAAVAVTSCFYLLKYIH